jgi:hypothetical protein
MSLYTHTLAVDPNSNLYLHNHTTYYKRTEKIRYLIDSNAQRHVGLCAGGREHGGKVCRSKILRNTTRVFELKKTYHYV